MAASKASPPKRSRAADEWDQVGKRIFGILPSEAAAMVDTLTPREKEVIRLSSKTAKEIGEELKIESTTVEIHQQNVYRKLHIRGREALVLSLASRFWAEGPGKKG